ncbi:MAG: hypothetical protein GY832_22105 [Chloroflexi bacterium]|nr:hypothetical protein [Chloroflexota bacterium]
MGDGADDLERKEEVAITRSEMAYRMAYRDEQKSIAWQTGRASPAHWKTQSEEVVKIADMDDRHIANVLAFLKRKGLCNPYVEAEEQKRQEMRAIYERLEALEKIVKAKEGEGS